MTEETQAKQFVCKSNIGTQVLIADDDPVSLRLIEASLEKWGYSVSIARDGHEAWRILSARNDPQMAILDWMMPGMDGPALCRKIRAAEWDLPPYVILVTARSNVEDIISGLDAGANDYVTKPFYQAELRARIGVGVRVLELQQGLAGQIRKLEEALAQVKQLRGLVPICMYCKRVRNDRDYWQQVESYVSEHSEAEFSHGICPECYTKMLATELG